MLGRWLDQPKTDPRCDSTDRLWLTRGGNPHTSQSLDYLLGRLCDVADIPTDNRDISWYSIGHSVGTVSTRAVFSGRISTTPTVMFRQKYADSTYGNGSGLGPN